MLALRPLTANVRGTESGDAFKRRSGRMVRSVIWAVAFFAAPVIAEAQWAYLTPPWNFDTHPKYAGKDIQAIPLSEWEQLAAFDSAAKCERARLFAREIRNLSPNDREWLVALFATGAEDQARREAQSGIAYDRALKKALPEALPDVKELVRKSEAATLEWWSASKCVPLR